MRGFIYRPHQGKERAYVAALEAAGYVPIRAGKARPVQFRRAAFTLFDLSNGSGGLGFQPALQLTAPHGVPAFFYPHAARPPVQWDGLYPVWPGTRCHFVQNEGSAEVMRRYGYPFPVEVTGWTLCKIRPFEPVREVRRVLFGPIHPNANGWISAVDRDLNRRAEARLVEYCRATGAELVVRHVLPLESSGLARREGIEYILARPDLSTREIDQSDCVVGHQTFAYLAVARGVPTLMIGEDVPPRTGNSERTFAYVKSWEKYGDYLAYPLDILAGDVETLIKKACRRNAAVTAWRKRFIGDPFDPGKFVERLERYL